MSREQEVKNELATANFSHDYIFGKVMQYKDNSLKMLRAIFPQLEINSLRKFQSQQRIDNRYEAHSVILDIFAKDDLGRVFDVEMQVEANPGFWKRTWYYLAPIAGADLRKGQSYDDKKESFLVFIMAYDERGKGKFRYECDFLCDHERVDTGSSITLLNAQGTTGKVTPELRDVFYLMNDQLSQVKTPFGKQLIKDIDRAKLDLAKEREFMDWVARLHWAEEDAAQAEEKVATLQATLNAERNATQQSKYQDALTTTKQLRQLGISDQQVSTVLQKVYGDNLSTEQIDQIVHAE